MLSAPQCIYCKNFIYKEGIFTTTCKAFPRGIPQEIWNKKVKHDKPYLNDNGIMFEPDEEYLSLMNRAQIK